MPAKDRFRYRFRIRKERWRPDETEMDSTLKPDLQLMDHLCFSSQFYFIAGFNSLGIVLLIIGST